MTRRPTIVAVAISILFAGAVAAQGAPAAGLANARAAYEQRGDPERARAAVELFKEAAKADATSVEARWEGARAAYYYGTYARADAPDSEKMAIFDGGIELAKQAVALAPKDVEAHFWLGVLYGVYGEAKGVFKSLSLVPSIKQEMKTCLEIDPSVEGWGPDRVLGRMYYKLPFFKGGDNKKSIEHLEKSLAGAPTDALTKLYLAETYKSEGMKGKAIDQLKGIVTMTPDPRWAPEHPSIRAKAEKLLAKLQ
ncbi:MAG TPA: TRAP transporter TatT component family protein [Thermoanaerobaculaceae bacterium]|nr:TRAP transporter TatT component family protein [Thermoanaerobaculaceae bacterium]